MNPLQRLLEGMPARRPPLAVREKDGWCVVSAGPVAVFGSVETTHLIHEDRPDHHTRSSHPLQLPAERENASLGVSPHHPAMIT